MNTILVDGRKLKEKKMTTLKAKVAELSSKGIVPHLVVVQVGSHSASTIYIKHKEKMAKELGMDFTKCQLPDSISFNELKKQVDEFNNDKEVDGIIIQFPLPASMKDEAVNTLVDPKKDADGIHPLNQGIISTRENVFAPKTCTPFGIMELLKEYNIEVSGKDAVVIGRSNIVGRPMAHMLENANASVTSLHSKSSKEDFLHAVKHADLIVSATGSKDVVTLDMVKPGVAIIDVGIIRGEDNKIRGDLAYKDFIGKVSHISPVPGGVGPMTVTMLMHNTALLAEKYRNK